MTPSERPLRFLMLTNTPWERTLGAARVQLELAEELQAMGHSVEKFSHEDAFPEAIAAPPKAPGRIGRLVDLVRSNRSFGTRAKAFVRAQGRRFDIIDAYHSDLPFSKPALGFPGLLVARSVALIPAYGDFNREAAERWPEPFSARAAVHRLLTYPAFQRKIRDVLPSFRHADLINVSNQDDLRRARDAMGFGDKVVCLPFGLSRGRRDAFRIAQPPPSERLAGRTVAFIGTWNHRKGSRDWPTIAERVLARAPRTRFLLLGTGFEAAAVLRQFPVAARPAIEVMPRFASEELPLLLARATVGAFPGYLEGFGFAVLENLASGLPTVTYDATGPREMMRHQTLSTVTPRGNPDAFAHEIVRLLDLPPEQYARYAAESNRIASLFRWEEIARQTCAIYAERLTALEEEAPR